MGVCGCNGWKLARWVYVDVTDGSWREGCMRRHINLHIADMRRSIFRIISYSSNDQPIDQSKQLSPITPISRGI